MPALGSPGASSVAQARAAQPLQPGAHPVGELGRRLPGEREAREPGPGGPSRWRPARPAGPPSSRSCPSPRLPPPRAAPAAPRSPPPAPGSAQAPAAAGPAAPGCSDLCRAVPDRGHDSIPAETTDIWRPLAADVARLGGHGRHRRGKPGTGARRSVETVTRKGGAVERAEKDQIERVINHELKERFGRGAVQRAVLLEHGDDPAIEPGQLMVRVFVPAPDEPADYEQALAAWQDAHRAGMEEMRRELSLRLPAARLLEFTFDDPGADTPRITMPDDGSLAAEQMSGREIVTTALSLLRANYVFPEVAEQAATAVEARLAAGEYDDLDEITLTELLTRHLQDAHRGQAPEAAPRRRPAARGPAVPGPRPGGPAARRPGRRHAGRNRAGAGQPRGQAAGHAADGAAGQLRHPPGRTAGRQRRLPRRAPGRGPGQRRPGHRRGDGAGRRDLRAHHRPAAQRRRLAGGRGLLVQLPADRGSRPTSTTSSTPIPARPGSSGRCRTCRVPATSTARSTC